MTIRYFLMVLFLIGSVSAHMGSDLYGHHNDGYLFMWIFMALLVIAVVLFIIWLIRELAKKKYD